MERVLKKFRELKANIELCNKLISSHQKEYLRKRIRFIKFMFEGNNEVASYKKAGICKTTANKILHIIVEKGVEEISKSKVLKKTYLISEEKAEEIIKMVETESPINYGYTQNIFTGEITAEVIQQKYGIKISRDAVYDLFHRYGLSYHKGHRDYIEADKEKQKEYQKSLKKNWQTKKKTK